MSVLGGLESFWALGPVRRAGRIGSVILSVFVKSPLVLDLVMSECPPLFLGRDEETKGETVCLDCRLFMGMGFVYSELLAPICDDDSERSRWIELLLRICARPSSVLSSECLREKNETLEAVMGLLGVLALIWRGGGVTCPSENAGSWRASTFAAVGMLKGKRFRGGSRKGFKLFFLLTGVASCWSASGDEATGPGLRGLGSRSFFIGSRIDALPDKLFVEVLFILLASKGMLDLRLL